MTLWPKSLLFVGAAFLMLSSQEASAFQDYSAEVAAKMEALRSVWPGIPDAQIIEADTLAVRNGEIQVGRPAIARLLAPSLGEAGTHLLGFVLAHEAWHTVQLRRLGPQDVARLRGQRLLECEADFMAATVTARQVRKAELGREREYGIRKAIADHVAAATVPSVDAAYYPAPTRRAQAVALAWTSALEPGLIRLASGGGSAASEAASAEVLARETCRKITNANDGSLGQISIFSETEEGAVGSSADPAPYKVRITNVGTRPVEVSYLIVATGNKQAVASGPWIEEIYDVVEHSLVAPARGMAEQIHHLKGYDLADPLRKYSHVIVSAPFHAPGAPAALLTSRYVGQPQPSGPYCRDATAEPERAQDRNLVKRLATISLAAGDRFQSIAGERLPDLFGMRQYKLGGGLAQTPSDKISVLQTGTVVDLTLFESDDEEAVRAEYERLLSMLKRVCGATSVEAEGGEEPGAGRMSLTRFAPKVLIGITAQLWRNADLPEPEGSSPAPGGMISATIMRDESWDSSE